MMIRLISKITTRRQPMTTLTLPWEQRIQSRLRVTLDNGAQAGLFLEHGTVLHDRDQLVSDDGVVIAVRAAEESLSTVTSDDSLRLARACYHLGNRHTPLEISTNQLRYLHDPVLDHMIKGLGLAVRRNQAPFEPETGAYAGQGHHHD
ncbi:MAG: urease accessory protein UreE [Desulfatitalea sp. BRH_c12]|nr:MAG: urease accessory protein UreE [Desulfatitalea sp. BRH_c12]